MVKGPAYNVLGLMSGTSLDGTDLAYCSFVADGDRWNYTIGAAATVPYDEAWLNRLRSAAHSDAAFLAETHALYGRYLGTLVNNFIAEQQLKPDLVASHGHTIFHQPARGFTCQVGDGAAIHAATGLPVVSDFRTTDIALNGQGAPLVPIGDRDLFPSYPACLNLGGFANISYSKAGQIVAFDIAPCNIVMNELAQREGSAYDEGGRMAASGQVIPGLLQKLDELGHYRVEGARSLGAEWVNSGFMPVLQPWLGRSSSHLLATVSAHAAGRIAAAIRASGAASVLTTGGGAWNTHLLTQIRNMSGATLRVPDALTVNFKEALIFAYLGLLRMLNRPNALSSATGSSRDSIGGALYGPSW